MYYSHIIWNFQCALITQLVEIFWWLKQHKSTPKKVDMPNLFPQQLDVHRFLNIPPYQSPLTRLDLIIQLRYEYISVVQAGN